jgi:hypothetical protein
VCTAGITIEALFVSRYEPGNASQEPSYDELFRKEDGERRILLSLQRDGPNNAHFAEPQVPAGPVLSFGLNVGGEYRELDMPLDGVEGRPTVGELADGNVHHVAATYDVRTGEKAIYLDGVKRYVHVYPPGSPLATGGNRSAGIGNMLDHPWEAFCGVIDEVAVYNAALSADEVAEHFRRARDGGNYFPPAHGPDRASKTAL